MDTTLSAYQWLQLIGLGGSVGALGQGARMIVGLKKLNDATSGTSTSVSDLLQINKLIISLAIGFIAGALAAAGAVADIDKVSVQQILALAAAGYAGADFIEGFMQRTQAAPSVSAGQEGIGTALPGSGGDGAIGDGSVG
jgi:hypothetical protein